MGPAVLAVPILGIVALALMGKKKKPEALVIAPEAEGEPMTVVKTDTGEAVSVPTEDVDDLAEAIEGGDAEDIAETLDAVAVKTPGVIEAERTPFGAPKPAEAPPAPPAVPELLAKAAEVVPTEIKEAAVKAVPALAPVLTPTEAEEEPTPEEEIRTEGEEQPWQVPPTAPTPTAPPVTVTAEAVPADTLALAQKMINEEGSAGWKHIDPGVKAWQQSRQLVADGMYGQKSALRMGQEIGTLPLVRYWPRGSVPSTALPVYREALDQLADEAPEPRASALRASAMREQGQGFGTTSGKAVTDELSASWRETLGSGADLMTLSHRIEQLTQ